MKQPKHFYVGIKGVLYNPNLKKVLVLSRLDQKGKRFWDIPGGRVDDAENLEDTLQRELREEVVNLDDNYEVLELLNAYRLSKDLKDGLGLVLLFYKVETELEEIDLSDEHDDYRWVGKEDLDRLTESEDIYIEKGYFDALRAALG